VLPRIEVDNLVDAGFEALDLAAERYGADGYQGLLGEQRVLEGEENSEPWAEELGGR